MRLNLRVISAVLLLIAGKFWESELPILNVRMILAVYPSIIMLWIFCIRVTVLLKYFDLFDNVSGALTWGPLTRWGLFCYIWGTEYMLNKTSCSWSCSSPCDHMMHLQVVKPCWGEVMKIRYERYNVMVSTVWFDTFKPSITIITVQTALIRSLCQYICM